MRISLKSDVTFTYQILDVTPATSVNANEIVYIDVIEGNHIAIDPLNSMGHIEVRGSNMAKLNIIPSTITSTEMSFAFLDSVEKLSFKSSETIQNFDNMLLKSKIDVVNITIPNIPANVSDLFDFSWIGKLDINKDDTLFDNVVDFKHSKIDDDKLLRTGNIVNLEDTTIYTEANSVNFEHTVTLDTVSDKPIAINPLLGVIRGRGGDIVPSKYENTVDTTVDNNYNFEMDMILKSDGADMSRNYTQIPPLVFNTSVDNNYNFEMDMILKSDDTDMTRNYTEIPTFVFDTSIDNSYNFEMDIINPHVDQI